MTTFQETDKYIQEYVHIGKTFIKSTANDLALL